MSKIPRNPPQLHRQQNGYFFKKNCSSIGCTFLVEQSRMCKLCDTCTSLYGCPCGNRPKKTLYWKIYRKVTMLKKTIKKIF